MRNLLLATAILAGIAAAAHAEETPGGLPALLADQITGIAVVSLNDTPKVRAPTGRYWSWDNLKNNALVAQTHCAGYEMESGETWRFCELTNLASGAQDYFWQDHAGKLVVGPVEWN